MFKKSLFYMIIISCCFINISCKKKSQSSESNADTMTPTQDIMDTTTSNDNVENAENNQTNISSEPETETDNSIIPINTSKPFKGQMNLHNETEIFLYGTWQVEKLLGFANSYNDASEYPTGQKVIDDKIIIKEDLFSSMELKNYDVYQYITRDPLYDISTICYNSDSFYRLFKIDLPGLNVNDEVKWLEVYLSSTEHGLSIPVSFFVVNHDRLILLLEATCFELKKVVD
ncbi:hypothetical protein [Lachnoclostridium phytofermentans]|uniref:Uncharacterized protein n=1 Tax=Lachnoclostridium phytofermentans (strain ATCC 700394 / DSM 18823 / ISDg) TaxID=357809 RepID=A9KSD2_LACP7|nr:hypothetical protein [Lachnoclostridium phytofermentans]ABX42164.1 hypothetical protein Cphy_1795 [Lachnoclostridium phytofermentans ISDg]